MTWNEPGILLTMIDLLYIVSSAIAYVTGRMDKRQEAVARKLQRLHGDLPQDVRECIWNHHSPFSYLIPVSLAVLVILAAGLTVAEQGEYSLTPIFFGFLGASLFIVQMIYRRYVALDLKPAVYFFATTRMFVAMILAFVAHQMFDAGPIPHGEELAYAFGFFAGVFPESALLALRTWIVRQLPGFKKQAEVAPLPLSMLQGCTSYQQARLLEEGIEDAHNLATADITRLVIRTPFDVSLLVDWIDQAILYTHTPNATLQRLRKSGVRSMSDFISVFHRVIDDQYGCEDDAVKMICEATKIPPSQILLLFYSTREHHNQHLVREFWQRERSNPARALQPVRKPQSARAPVPAVAMQPA